MGPSRDFGLRDTKAGNSARRARFNRPSPDPASTQDPVAVEAGTGLPTSCTCGPRSGPHRAPSPEAEPQTAKGTPARAGAGRAACGWGPHGQRLQPSATRGRALSLTAPRSPASAGTCSGSPHSPPASGFSRSATTDSIPMVSIQRGRSQPTGAAEGGDQRCE